MIERFEIKTAFGLDEEKGLITGIAWPFGTPDRVGDMIEKGAFAMPTVIPMLFEHDRTKPVGAWNSAVETDKGLEVRGALLVDDVALAREVRALAKAGAITGLSIGFQTKSATPRRGGGRNISALDLLEISLVSIPAHPGARVTSAKAASKALRLAEAINRAASAFSSK